MAVRIMIPKRTLFSDQMRASLFYARKRRLQKLYGDVWGELSWTNWRVLIYGKNGSGSNTGSGEIIFKGNGEKKNGVPFGSGGAPGNAFDGDNTTNWTVTGTYGEYVGLTFQTDTLVDEVEIVSLFNDYDNTILEYAVQYQDPDTEEWITLWESWGNQKYTGNGQSRTSTRPHAAIESASVIEYDAYAIHGMSNETMIQGVDGYTIYGMSSEAFVAGLEPYAVYGAGDEAFIAGLEPYAVYGAGDEAFIAGFEAYAIYDAGS